MYYDTTYSGTDKQVPGATAVGIKPRSVLVSRTWKSLTEVTFELRLRKESDDGDRERIADRQYGKTQTVFGGWNMWLDLTEAQGVMMKMILREIVY